MDDLLNPSSSYFSIGEVISVLALLLAFSQFLKPISRFRLYVNWVNLGWIYALAFTFVTFIFVAAILPFVPGPALWILGYPATWQIGGGFLLFITISWLILVTHRRATFGKWNATRYLEYSLGLIATISEEDLRQLGFEIYVSIPNVLQFCSTYELEKRKHGISDKEYEPAEHILRAMEVLYLWSDKDFCRVLVCRCPATVIKVFSEIEKRRSYAHGYNFVQQLVDQSFNSRKSILYKEDDFYGLGLTKECTRAMFGNYHLVNSGLMPLSGWKTYELKSIRAWQIKKYMSVVNVTLNAYFTAKAFHEYPRCFFHARDVMNTVAGRAVAKMATLDAGHVYESEQFEVLNAITEGIKDLLETIYKNDLEINVEYPFDPDNYVPHKDNSIYGVAAGWAYQLLGNLSRTDKHDWQLRLCAYELWSEIFEPFSTPQPRASSEIAKRLTAMLREKVNENLDALRPKFPAMARLLIELRGLREPSTISATSEEDMFFRFFYTALKERYATLAMRQPEAAKHMLPESTKYDENDSKLVYFAHKEKHSELKLNPPS